MLAQLRTGTLTSQELALTTIEIEGLAARLGSVDPDLEELLADLLEALESPSLERLQPLAEALDRFDLVELAARAQEQAWHQQVAAVCQQDFEESELVRGHYARLESALEEWLEAERDSAAMVSLLEVHRDRVAEEQRAHEDRYLTPEEWTIPVAAADRLLCQAYQLWLEGLEQLLVAVSHESDDLAPSLELLLAGNANFLKVERLAQLRG